MLYAHTGSDSENKDTWQSLTNHLNGVADLASSFADDFGGAEWGRMLGLLHDAGKCSAAFQRRLADSDEHVDHSTAGAHIALNRYGKGCGTLAAYCIVGHHGGQPNGIKETRGASKSRTPLETRLNRSIEPYDAFWNLIDSGDISLPSPEALGAPLPPNRICPTEKGNADKARVFAAYVYNRMLFSALVDADYLDTEHAMAPETAQARTQHASSSLKELSKLLDARLVSLQNSDSAVNRARASVLADCVAAASHEQGLFSLTVPTGGGKTLSSLAFALKHAIAHGMKRVIVAIPFASIVEQTAQIFKDIFGAHNVLEHHSNYDFADLDNIEAHAQRLLAQNWDAPIVVTTNVQLLESLYANKPGKSRKMHNIANSVVVLDEAQTLPDGLLVPSLAMLEELTFSYNTSIVLCTATQPALSMLWPFDSSPHEIIEHTESFQDAFGERVNYEMLGEQSLEQITDHLLEHDQALCIVGTKKGARLIYESLIENARAQGKLETNNDATDCGYFHLSALMTPQHRSETLAKIHERLDHKKSCIVVSTQLIEAGVDVDFPVVFRELAGVDSLVQAAGRCNREGGSETGQVRVFELLVDGDILPTSSWLDKMKTISRDLIRDNENAIDDSLVEPFFVRRYRTKDTDEKDIFAQLSSTELVTGLFRSMPFEQVAHDYHIIEDAGVPLFIPYGQEATALLRELTGSNDHASLSMKLQRFSVSVSFQHMMELEHAEAIKEIGPFKVLREERVSSLYRDDVGLLRPEEETYENLFI